jgi:hypothetical protein
MSVNRLSRQKLSTICDRRNYTIINYELEPYWDEGYICHYSKGWRTHRRRKVITHKQYRAFRTWKHNRKHQWK